MSLSVNDVSRPMQPLQVENEVEIKPDLGGVSVQKEASNTAEAFDLVEISREGAFISIGRKPDEASKQFKLEGVPLLPKELKEKPVRRGMDTPTEARDRMFEACQSFKRKYVDADGIKAKLDEFKKALAKETDSKKVEDLQTALAALEVQAFETIKAREKVVRFVPTEARKLKNLNPSQKELDQIAVREMKEAEVALRNLKFDLKRTHGLLDRGEKASFGLRNFFSTTRNKVFRAMGNASAHPNKVQSSDLEAMKNQLTVNQKVSSNEIAAADRQYDDLLLAMSNFSKLLPGAPEAADEGGHALKQTKEALEDIKVLRSGLSTLSASEPQFSRHLEKNMLSTLKEMCGGQSEIDFVLTAHAGALVPVPVAKLEVGAKYEYSFRVTTEPSGRVTITRVHAGGVQGKAELKFGENAKLQIKGEAKIGKGKGIEYADIESAAHAIVSGKLGPLTALCVKGADVMYILKSALKIGTARPGKPNYDPGEMLQDFKARGLLDKVDEIDFAQQHNVRLVSDRKFFQGGGGVSGLTKVNAGPARVRGELSGGGHREFGAIRNDYHSYYAYFTTDRVGEAGHVYRQLTSDNPLNSFERQSVVKDLLERAPSSDDEKAKLARDILDEMKSMLQKKKTFDQDEIARARTPEGRAPISVVCARLRQATVALVAMEDKVRDFLKNQHTDFAKEFAETLGALRDELETPGVKMTDEQLVEELYVTRTHGDDKVVAKGHFYLAADFVTNATNNLLSNDVLSNSGSMNVGNELGRMAADGLMQGIGGTFGLMPSAEVDVRYEVPKTTDPRPFRQSSRVTLSIRPNADVTGREILRLIEGSYRKAMQQSQLPLKDHELDRESLAETFGMKAGIGAGLRLLFEGMGAISGDSPDDYVAGSDYLADNFYDYKWTTQKLISFQFEDGRLVAVGAGDAGTFEFNLDLNVMNVVEVGGSVSHDKQIVKRSYYPTPSFDSLVSKCDSFLAIGHRAEWNQFAMDNKSAFLRMAGIIVGDKSVNDKNVKDDAARYAKTIERMFKEYQSVPKYHVQQRARLAENINRMAEAMNALGELHESLQEAGLSTEEKAEREQRLITSLCTLMETVSDHYNILESVGGHGGALAMDELKNLTEREGENDDYVVYDWKGKSV